MRNLINQIKFYLDNRKRRKRYRNYEDYVKHQIEKTNDPIRRKKWLNEEWNDKLDFFQNCFENLLREYPYIRGGKGVGLGARAGQEIQAMKNVGFDAIGVDLVPCEPLVIKGDIHKLEFESNSFDFIFTNIFDHSLYPVQFISEIIRVAKSRSLVLMHLSIGEATDEFGVTDVTNTKTIVKYFGQSEVLRNCAMKPWGGLNWELLVKIKK